MAQNKSNIVLIGMPAVGKSTVGVLLAKQTGRLFVDTDVLIQAAVGKTLPEIIAQQGMDGFCRIEQDYISCLDVQNAVIATGGSAVYYPPAMTALKQNGWIVYLWLPLNELKSRLDDLNARGVVFEPGQTLDDLYRKREPLYQRWADLTVNLSGLNHQQAVSAVLEKIRPLYGL